MLDLLLCFSTAACDCLLCSAISLCCLFPSVDGRVFLRLDELDGLDGVLGDLCLLTDVLLELLLVVLFVLLVVDEDVLLDVLLGVLLLLVVVDDEDEECLEGIFLGGCRCSSSDDESMSDRMLEVLCLGGGLDGVEVGVSALSDSSVSDAIMFCMFCSIGCTIIPPFNS